MGVAPENGDGLASSDVKVALHLVERQRAVDTAGIVWFIREELAIWNRPQNGVFAGFPKQILHDMIFFSEIFVE